ncbi:MAG: hypothetical protein ABTQ25_01685 [Nitrosomonas ureae]
MATDKHSRTFIFVCISAVGFFFHLIWEYMQCSPLFIHLKVTPTFWSMICATFGDVGILWAAYLVTAALKRDISWPWSSHAFMSWVSFVAFSAGIAEVVEYFSVSRELWTYSPINPTFRGVSVVPLFQMAVLNPLTILVTKRLLILRESTT